MYTSYRMVYVVQYVSIVQLSYHTPTNLMIYGNTLLFILFIFYLFCISLYIFTILLLLYSVLYSLYIVHYSLYTAYYLLYIVNSIIKKVVTIRAHYWDTTDKDTSTHIAIRVLTRRELFTCHYIRCICVTMCAINPMYCNQYCYVITIIVM